MRLLNIATGIAAAAAAALVLAPTIAAAAPPVQFGFGLNIGPDGKPSVSIGVGTPHAWGQVCLFERSRYRGDSFCMDPNTSIRDLNDWADAISSIENPDGLNVTVCTRSRFRGDCRTYSGSARSLGRLDDRIESIRVSY
jgi:hypothetical protein